MSLIIVASEWRQLNGMDKNIGDTHTKVSHVLVVSSSSVPLAGWFMHSLVRISFQAQSRCQACYPLVLELVYNYHFGILQAYVVCCVVGGFVVWSLDARLVVRVRATTQESSRTAAPRQRIDRNERGSSVHRTPSIPGGMVGLVGVCVRSAQCTLLCVVVLVFIARDLIHYRTDQRNKMCM